MTWESLEDVVKRLEAGTPPPPLAGLFGGSPRPAECALVLIPVPWDATVSYGTGTAKGPDAIVGASHQLDLEDGCFDQPYRAGIAMLPDDREILSLNGTARTHADEKDLAAVNAASKRVNERVHTLAREGLAAGQLVGVLGGDHSSPYGLLEALAELRAKPFGVLHFDAHHDLRMAYEGFAHSHASIMYNVTHDLPQVSQLVQVGIRDYSAEERAYAQQLGARNATFYARDLFRRKALGESWAKITADVVGRLPDDVYVSFDIDGLDPTYCPSTGTPVPGGLGFDEALFMLEELARSGRKIIGFDLCEVTPGAGGDEWDANVGARVLYKLCGAALASNGHCKLL